MSWETDEAMIDRSQIEEGTDLIIKNAEKMFRDGKFLYDNAKYQSAIPLFVAAIQETLRVEEMNNLDRKGILLSSQRWDAILVKTSLTSEGLDRFADEQIGDDIGAKDAGYTSEEIAENRENAKITCIAELGEFAQLEHLVKFCTCRDWNRESCSWSGFDERPSEQKLNLPYYVMKLAEERIAHTGYMREMYEIGKESAKSAKDLSGMLADLCKNTAISKDNPRYNYGKETVNVLMLDNAHGMLTKVAPYTLQKFLSNAYHINHVIWDPHLLTKAMLNALAIAGKAGIDGTYAGTSKDSIFSDNALESLTSGALCDITVAVKVQDGTITVDRIMINNQRYTVGDALIQKIIDTERVMEAEPEEISEAKLREALSVVGLQLKVMDKNDIKTAINTAVSSISNSEINMHESVRHDIKSITPENWMEKGLSAREVIIGLFAESIPDPDTIIITHYESQSKTQARRCILSHLINRASFGMADAGH